VILEEHKYVQVQNYYKVGLLQQEIYYRDAHVITAPNYNRCH